MEPVRPPRPRWVRAAVAGVVAFELVAAAALVARSDRDDAAAPPRPAASIAPTITSRPHNDSADRSNALRASAVDALLARRARAVRARDLPAFLATLDRSSAAFVQRQRKAFAALAAVPIAEWRYEVDPADTALPPGSYRGEAWAPRVNLRYRLRGFDDKPAATTQYFTFVRRGDAWLVANDRDYDNQGRRTGRDLWDLGPVAVVRGARSLVLGRPGNHAFLRDVARHADEAAPRVSKVWGQQWPRKVVVVVPGTAREVAEIIGGAPELARIAAVAVADVREGASPSGNRVIVNPENFRRLGATGRRVVMTHEVTHIATRDAGATSTPTWLVEGFADYVGYLGAGLSPRAICQELAADVRAGRAPRALPADTDFDGANTRLAQAYESAWLAVRLIAEREGERGLVRLYRRAAKEPLAAVITDELGLTNAEFTAAWRAYVRRTLG